MPTVGVFHRHFVWDFSDTNAAPIHISGGGYPGWQAGVITPSLFGIIGAWIDARWALVKWHLGIARRLHRLSSESRGVVLRVLTAVEHPAYPSAQAAVRKTATTLGFNQAGYMNTMGHYLKDSRGRLENTYRHLHACKTLQETAGSTLTNHEQNFLTELAYVGFTISRK
jgi:hypothetical protein